MEIKEKKVKPKKESAVPYLSDEAGLEELFPGRSTPVLFLDFDGTLSHIVNQPEDATISGDMKAVLRKCASVFTTAVVSGRDMDDVRARTGIDEVIYAGSHGFRISGPDNLYMEHEITEKILPGLDKLEELLRDEFSGGPEGVKVERKRYAIAVHYRNAPTDSVDEVRSKVSRILDSQEGFRTGEGKKIIEVKPDIDWDKGKAVRWIIDKFNLWDDPAAIPVYIGDDTTDEDAFRMISGRGIGILVGSHGQPTYATYRLKDVEDVRDLLEKLFELRNRIKQET